MYLYTTIIFLVLSAFIVCAIVYYSEIIRNKHQSYRQLINDVLSSQQLIDTSKAHQKYMLLSSELSKVNTPNRSNQILAELFQEHHAIRKTLSGIRENLK